MDYTNQVFTTRLILATSTIIRIILCQFHQIRNSNAGGALYVYDSNYEFNQRYNEFFNNSGADGGSVYVDVKKAYSYGICIVNSKGSRGSGIFQICSSNNQINSSTTAYCSSSFYATWDLCYGIATANHVNTSYCSATVRESASHYGGGPICSTTFFTCCGNIGPGIFGPFSGHSGMMPHSFCNFIYNKAGSFGVIAVWSGEHQLIKCVFLLNEGDTSSSGSGSYIGLGSLLYVDCSFDASPTGYYISTSNCIINGSPTTYYPLISVSGICNINILTSGSSNKAKMIYLLYALCL